MILVEIFGRCSLCKNPVPAIAQAKEGTPLCLSHWRKYALEMELTLSESTQPEDRQRLLELGDQAGYPEIQIWPHMRLCPGRVGYIGFCRWHDNPADTQQAVKKLEKVIVERARRAAHMSQLEADDSQTFSGSETSIAADCPALATI